MVEIRVLPLKLESHITGCCTGWSCCPGKHSENPSVECLVTLYIDWLRSRTQFAMLLEPWVRTGTILTCGVIRVEVIRRVLDSRQRQRTEEFFDLISEIPVDWRKVTDLGWKMDRGGITLPITDLIIASCALSVGAAVITRDKHFRQVPGLECREYL